MKFIQFIDNWKKTRFEDYKLILLHESTNQTDRKSLFLIFVFKICLDSLLAHFWGCSQEVFLHEEQYFIFYLQNYLKMNCGYFFDFITQSYFLLHEYDFSFWNYNCFTKSSNSCKSLFFSNKLLSYSKHCL